MCSCASRPTRPARSEIFCRTGGNRQTRPRERRPAGFSADLTPGASPRASLTSRTSCDRTMRDQNRSCEGVRMETVTELLRLPARSPNLNAYAERFVGSIKSECLRYIVPIGERHLRGVVREYVEHYHHERNHQGLDNVIPLPLGQPGKEAIRRHERLGGVRAHYRRAAAQTGPSSFWTGRGRRGGFYRTLDSPRL